MVYHCNGEVVSFPLWQSFWERTQCKQACLLGCLVLELDGNWGHKSLPFVFLAWEVLFLRPYNIQLSCLQKNPSKPWLLYISVVCFCTFRKTKKIYLTCNQYVALKRLEATELALKIFVMFPLNYAKVKLSS